MQEILDHMKWFDPVARFTLLASIGKLITFAALAVGIYFAAAAFFLTFACLILKLVNRNLRNA